MGHSTTICHWSKTTKVKKFITPCLCFWQTFQDVELEQRMIPFYNIERWSIQNFSKLFSLPNNSNTLWITCKKSYFYPVSVPCSDTSPLTDEARICQLTEYFYFGSKVPNGLWWLRNIPEGNATHLNFKLISSFNPLFDFRQLHWCLYFSLSQS